MGLSEDISKTMNKAGKHWRKKKQKADRDHRVHDYTGYIPSSRITQKEVAFDIMEDIYNLVSSNANTMQQAGR